MLGRVWRVRMNPWWLATVALGCFAFAIRVAAADQQSAYMDEGTNVITGRMLIEQHATYAEFLNWAYGSYVWPLLAGLADEAGGLRMVRGVTAVFGVLMVLSTALAAARLAPASIGRERRWAVALVAGAIVALAPTAIGVARFGTYDAMAAATFMLGVTLLIGAQDRVPRLHLLTAAVLLFVAFLAKYLVAIYFPLVCIYVMLRHTRHIRAVVHDAVWFVLPLSAACAAYALVYLTPLINLLTSSLHYGDLRSPDPLREYVWTRPELWLLLAAVAYAWRFADWQSRIIAVGGSSIIAGFQVAARPDFDFWKHSVYLIFFLAPIAALNWLRIDLRTGTSRVVSVAAAPVLALLAWGPAIQQADQMIAFYPNLNPSISAIQKAIAGSALVLTDDSALRYYLLPTMDADRVVGPFFFTYQSQDGIEAYRRAIADRFFDAIVLDGGVTPQGASIRGQLAQTILDSYQQVYAGKDGDFTVEVFKPLRPAGSVSAEDAQLNWQQAFVFDSGFAGWGAHPQAGDWQAGNQLAISTTPNWNGHPSLQFTPTWDSTIVSLRAPEPEHVTRLRARVWLVPAGDSGTPIRVGFMGFDSSWQWHDDGFRWVVPPGSWTTISWDLPKGGDYSEVGLIFPGRISQAYVGSFEIDP